ncbi:MGMT family protein [Vallitalea okinawensis]|uniref:MGMT family protein n=1 Tax=Vallitalea okinawensis TaxID=2078660 RepID=UPI000CFC59C6|nr:MGMT family protein [Vallitalea okinawensis]
MTPYTKKIIEVIKDIPAGMVMTYGQIAAVAGNPRGARQVSRALHSMSKKHHLPWHRVINSQGKISLKGDGFEEQKKLLELEGVRVEKDKVDLKKYQYDPFVIDDLF